jgi:hypothetical protein
MTEHNSTRSGISTASIVFAIIALALTLLGYANGSAIVLLLGILSSVAGLALGIAARREAAITISAVMLLGGLAIGFGLIH